LGVSAFAALEGSQASAESASQKGSPQLDRLTALQTCPARAQDWAETLPHLPTEELDSRQQKMEPAVKIADDYLGSLPGDQAGELRNDPNESAVVVQVTHSAEQVREALQAKIGPLATVKVETIRYSMDELQQIAARIAAIPGLNVSGMNIGGGNDRVAISVAKDPLGAIKAISRVADPCSFVVKKAGYGIPLNLVTGQRPAGT
jgi:hypothetical protein